MNKILWIIGISIIAVVIGFFIGKNILKPRDNEEINIAEHTNNTVILKKENNTNKEEIQTNSSEEKISVNTTIHQITYYNECGHQIENEIKNIEKYINMTKEELQKEFTEWEIKEFNRENVVLYKEENDFCNEHFLVKDEDGFVTIYTINNEEEILELLDKTDIATNYLTRNRSRQFKRRNDYIHKTEFK